MDADITLAEWQTRTPARGSGLEGRALDGPAARALAAELARAGMLEVTELRVGLSVKSFAHVGRVRLGGLTVTVLPKVGRPALLNLLRYAYGLRRLRLLPHAAQALTGAGFADLLVCQLTAEAEELLARGPHRSYAPRAEWLPAPRGRLDLGRLARHGGETGARLPCVHHPRVEDTPLNRALRGGLALAGSVAADVGLRRAAHRLAAALGESAPGAPLTAGAIGQAFASLNRLTEAYRPALTLIRLLHESQGPALGGGGVVLPGFLFDMNRFFQELLSRFLRDHLPGYEVRDERGLRGVMQFLPDYNPRGRRPPAPRPDFVVCRGGRPVAVLDAKYRDLWEKPLPPGMLYQLAVYAATQPDGAATILYPTVDAGAAEARVGVRDPATGRRAAQVNLRPVVLPVLEGLLLAGGGASAQRGRREYARSLLFGRSRP